MLSRLHTHTIRALRAGIAVLLVAGLVLLPSLSLLSNAETAFADPSIRNDNGQKNVDARFYLAILKNDKIKPSSETELKANLNHYTSPGIVIKNALTNPTEYCPTMHVGYEDFSDGGISYKLNNQPSDAQIQNAFPGYNPETQTVLWYVIKHEYDGWHVDGILLDKEAAPIGPVDPVDPEDPEEPEDPNEPVGPDEPDEPADPSEPDEPTPPVGPIEPINPVDPTNPEDPTIPDDPTDPSTPDAPDNPVDPTNPEEPVDPVDPTSSEDDPIPQHETIDDFDEPAAISQKNAHKKSLSHQSETVATPSSNAALATDPIPFISAQVAVLMKGTGAAALTIAAGIAALAHAAAASQTASLGAWEQSVSRGRQTIRRSK